VPQPIRIPDVAGKVVALLGLGRTGSATAAALEASGAIVWAWDDNEEARTVVPAGMIVDLAKANWSRPEMTTTMTKAAKPPACAASSAHGFALLTLFLGSSLGRLTVS
jgi:glutamate dehydrogenase/leucine dehydrogenase